MGCLWFSGDFGLPVSWSSGLCSLLLENLLGMSCPETCFACSVALRGGREGCCKQITLACARSASVTLGLPPVHGACSLSAHAAQALDCSAANHPRPALGCLYFPGPSRSGSGTRVVLRGADSPLGLRFVPFPDPSSSGDEVFCARDCCDLSPPRCSVI